MFSDASCTMYDLVVGCGASEAAVDRKGGRESVLVLVLLQFAYEVSGGTYALGESIGRRT